jgi:hypothetical protein
MVLSADAMILSADNMMLLADNTSPSIIQYSDEMIFLRDVTLFLGKCKSGYDKCLSADGTEFCQEKGSRESPCNGTCPANYQKCGDACLNKKQSQDLAECNGECRGTIRVSLFRFKQKDAKTNSKQARGNETKQNKVRLL